MKIRQKQKGLTLIEMTIAIAILVVALLGALTLATFGIVAGGKSEMRVVAINLAREGVEVVRNKRDANWLAGNDWTNDIIIGNSIPVFSANAWQVKGVISIVPGFDPADPLTIIRVGSSPVFTKDELYLQDTASIPEAIATNFYRFINTEKVNDDELKIICYVVWQERDRWHLVNVEDHLFNWY